MTKLPDFSELSKKLDLQGLLDSVKSAVSGIGTPPKAPEGDEVAARFVETITLMQSLVATHAEQAKIIANVHHKLNALYKDVQASQQPTSSTEKSTKLESSPPVKSTVKKPTDTEKNK